MQERMQGEGGQTLKLSGLTPFGSGGKRDCFVHPEVKGLCVKVARVGREPDSLYRKAPWLRRWRKGVHGFDENHQDYQALQALESLGDPSVWNHLPRCFGWIDADRGRGLVIELLRDADGLISRSFLDYLWTEGYDERAQTAVEEFAEFWQSHAIPSRSLLLDNIVAQVRGNGTMRLVLIDGLGDNEFIPLPRWWRRYALIRSHRRVVRLRGAIAILPERKRKGDGPGPLGFLRSRN